ncbi:MAG: acyltransferase [Sporichthyaceae bacterium]
MGRHVYIGADFFLEADLFVGDDVLISSRVAVIGDDHPFDDSPLPITSHPRRGRSEVRIEGDNLIGHGTIIIAPATIGRGTIVGAGSLVTGDLPPDSVCVGRPARVIRKRRAGEAFASLDRVRPPRTPFDDISVNRPAT